MNIDKILLKNSIRLLIGGALYDDSIELNEIAPLLKDVAEDYETEIRNQEEK